MPNGVIKGINLRQVLICCAHHGIFISYDHHSVMKLLITSDKHCDVGMKADAGVPHGKVPLSRQRMYGITFHVIRCLILITGWLSNKISQVIFCLLPTTHICHYILYIDYIVFSYIFKVRNSTDWYAVDYILCVASQRHSASFSFLDFLDFLILKLKFS